jgi:hypothetical protein
MHPLRGVSFSVVLPIAFLLFRSCIVPAYGQAAPDFTQAQAMLELLRSCREGRASSTAIEKVLAFPGTALVVGQQNISRRVTMQQYREVLQAACAAKIADVKPAEAGARAEKGVKGLEAVKKLFFKQPGPTPVT